MSVCESLVKFVTSALDRGEVLFNGKRVDHIECQEKRNGGLIDIKLTIETNTDNNYATFIKDKYTIDAAWRNRCLETDKSFSLTTTSRTVTFTKK